MTQNSDEFPIDTLATVERPGCVNGYAFIAFIGTGLMGLFLAFTLALSSSTLRPSEFYMALAVLILSLGCFYVAYGLHKLKRWAWWVVIGVHAVILLAILGVFLAVIGSAIADFSAINRRPMIWLTIILSAGIPVVFYGVPNMIILRWFYQNRALFKDEPKIVVAETLKKGAKSMGVVEYVLILMLIFIVVIVILILLGPSVGNVFSVITPGLEAPPPN